MVLKTYNRWCITQIGVSC